MMQLYCPSCESNLTILADNIRCEKCARNWERREGILSFVGKDDPVEAIAPEKWERIFAAIEGKSNRQIQDYFASSKFQGGRELFNSFRSNKADAFSFLDVTDEDVILETGCGSGSLTVPLAKRCREIYALDASLSRLRLLQLRSKNDNLNNIISIHARASSLPFQGSCFDYVVLNDLGDNGREKDADLRDTLKMNLKTARELLKEKGRIFISAENRHGLEFLYKKRSRSKLYLPGFLPRFVADLITRKFRGEPYRVYSWMDYRKMLAEAGFRDIEFYYVWPDGNDPKYIFAAKDRNIFSYYLEHFLKNTISVWEYKLFRWAYQAGMESRFVPNFFIVGKK